MDLLPDAVALVTGAANGLGEQTCRLLAQEGINCLLLVDVDKENLDRVEKDVKQIATNPNFKAHKFTVDMRNEDAIKNMFQQVKTQFGKLDYAVNNAGIISKHLFKDFPTDEFDRITSVNQRGVFICMREEANIMLSQESAAACAQGRKRDRGVIVNVSSGAGSRGVPFNSAYVGSKHAVQGLTKCMAIDHAKDGLRVNCVAPGLMFTKIISSRAFVEERILPLIPAKRAGEPQEIANAILFLLSPKASYINGETLNVDGGYQAQ